jgi:predicted RNase H-like HicB family nuclease
MKYAVVYEKTERNYSAYVPDLPGCVATGTTRKEVERNIRDAIAFHVDGLRRGRLPVPKAKSWAELVEVAS